MTLKPQTQCLAPHKPKIKLAALYLSLWLSLCMGFNPQAQAAQTHLAVAANFAAAIKRLKPLFEQQTGHS